jgi:hypothetical protein
MKTFLLALFVLCSMMVSAQPFTKLTHQIGLIDTTGGEPYLRPQWGTGISAADFNSDGLDDLTFATGRGRPTLFYQNNGDGTFTKVFPTGNILEHTVETKGILWADIDNDGDKDCYITGFKNQNHLYRNNGNLDFTDITTVSGLPLQNDWTWGATFGDYDNDGYLDLYVCNRQENDFTNFLYRNKGNNTFLDVTSETQTSDMMRLSFMATFWDYNNDGFQDIIIANDRLWHPNTLLKNNGPGLPFTDVSVTSGIFEFMDAMNVGVGDFNNDGFDDVYITNSSISDTMVNHLMRNNGNGGFENIAIQAGIDFDQFSWAGNWLDYDNDMDLDMYVSSSSNALPVTQNSILFESQLMDFQTEQFLNPWPSGFAGDVAGYCHVICDFDEDGHPDIVSSYGGEDTIALFRNEVINNNHWVKVGLQGVISNRDGIGCRAEAWMNGQKIMRYKHCGEAYISQNSDFLHFGLGNNTVVDSIVIRWLSGVVDVLINPAIDQKHIITEGTQNAYMNLAIQTVGADCQIGNNGSASVSNLLGNYDFSYLWNTNDSTNSIQNLVPGIYTVTISYNGLNITQNVEVPVIPGGIDIPNNDIDENCDGTLLIIDDDNDGYNSDEDCDDNNNLINPAATEIANNMVDENCDNILLIIDDDNDGYNSDEDCDESNPDINPGATEIPNNTVDENCDQIVLITDFDGDGYDMDNDCNDDDPDINPGATEIPNNDVDEDCDGDVFIIDLDNDDFNSDEDCDDLDPDINPDATEIPNNNVDEDCDGVALIIDQDEDGFNSDEDCNDLNAEINPDAIDIPNNDIDEDCDGELAVPVLNVQANGLLIYPNPVKDELIVLTNTSRLARVTILDSKGVVVFESDDLLLTEVHIPVQYLPGGMYVVEILLEEGISNYNRIFVKM